MRSSSLVRICLVVFVLCLSWYTVKLYANLFGFGSQDLIVNTAKNKEVNNVDSELSDKVKDPDMLIDQEKIKDAEKQWNEIEKNVQIPIDKSNFQCEMTTRTCSENEFAFRIVSGAANVIGPSVCFDGKWVMKNALNNVERGMNIAVIDGITGKTVDKAVFDLYGKDSSELKSFLKKIKEIELVLITTYDDAAFKLDDEARKILSDFGSSKAKTLAFRDNWIFVGGKHLENPTGLEEIMVNDKEKNKFGDWPEAISLEGCVTKIKKVR